jgi:hypothetical protein
VPLHAFDRFTGADRARTTGSTGLSMAVVDTLTHRNQGTVTARNDPDRGAEVSIQLPAAPSPPTREERFSLRSKLVCHMGAYLGNVESGRKLECENRNCDGCFHFGSINRRQTAADGTPTRAAARVLTRRMTHGAGNRAIGQPGFSPSLLGGSSKRRDVTEMVGIHRCCEVHDR